MAQPEPARDSSIAPLEKVLYTAKTRSAGSRDGSASRTDDGRLDVNFTYPGTPGTGTNHEPLFAAGWSTCFLSAIKNVADKKKITLPNDIAIDAEMDSGTGHRNFSLAAALSVSLQGVGPKVAQESVDAAHQHCPHSRHGAIDTQSLFRRKVRSNAAVKRDSGFVRGDNQQLTPSLTSSRNEESRME
jgi:osmotically inducible protein OsmC